MFCARLRDRNTILDSQVSQLAEVDNLYKDSMHGRLDALGCIYYKLCSIIPDMECLGFLVSLSSLSLVSQVHPFCAISWYSRYSSWSGWAANPYLYPRMPIMFGILCTHI